MKTHNAVVVSDPESEFPQEEIDSITPRVKRAMAQSLTRQMNPSLKLLNLMLRKEKLERAIESEMFKCIQNSFSV